MAGLWFSPCGDHQPLPSGETCYRITFRLFLRQVRRELPSGTERLRILPFRLSALRLSIVWEADFRNRSSFCRINRLLVAEASVCLFTPSDQTFKELFRTFAGPPVCFCFPLPVCFRFQDSGFSGGRPGGPFELATASIKKGSSTPHRQSDLLFTVLGG
jgi:hypothetical protein